jgi:lysophospholipase L1-like esterase
MNVALYLTIGLFALSFSQACSDKENQMEIDLETLYPSPDIVNPYHTDWTKEHYKKRIAEFKASPLKEGEIVFIGDSITELGGNWATRFNNAKVRNRGIAGDVTSGVLNRLKEIYYFKPAKVFILIGINDLFHNDLTPAIITNNIKQIVSVIQKNSPGTTIYVQTILPTANASPSKERIGAVNTLLKSMSTSEKLVLIDLHAHFAGSDGMMPSGMTTDGLHLNESGYQKWVNFISTYVN